jgi:hypothetical protein
MFDSDLIVDVINGTFFFIFSISADLIFGYFINENKYFKVST